MITIEDGYIVEHLEYRNVKENIVVDGVVTDMGVMESGIKQTKYKVNLETGLLEEVIINKK